MYESQPVRRRREIRKAARLGFLVALGIRPRPSMTFDAELRDAVEEVLKESCI